MSKRHHSQHSMHQPSQRQRKVAEMIKQSLSDIFLNEPFYGTPLEGISITVSQVWVSPDLRNATIYATPMSLNVPTYFEETLNEYGAQLRHLVTRKLNLKYSPKLHFSRDNTFDEINRVEYLMAKLHKDEAAY